MAKVKVYNVSGKSVGEKDLNDAVFGVKPNQASIHEVVVGMMGNQRTPVAHTKTRGEVRGGGKKPWKQKGTGRARHGSTRSPIWVGGGITFGPRSDRDYTRKINRKMRRRAFCMLLSDKVANERLVLVEKIEAKDGKTKAVAALLANLPVKGGAITLVTPKADQQLTRGARNIQKVSTRSVNDVGLLDLVGSEYVIMTPEATDAITARYTGEGAAEASKDATAAAKPAKKAGAKTAKKAAPKKSAKKKA